VLKFEFRKQRNGADAVFRAISYLGATALTALMMAGTSAIAQQQLVSVQGRSVRALVVGIDDYTTVTRLKGAVADARDIEAALLRAGVPPSQIAVFIDGQASRQNLVAAFNRLVAEARQGELAVISFAGHGAQMKERIKGSEPDGLNEYFILSSFSRTGQKNAERIDDKEINLWLKRLDAKGVDVIFIADTCHGGGLARNWDPRAGAITYRTAGDVQPIGEDFFRSIYDEPDATSGARISLKELQITIPDLKRVTFLAAADKNTKSPEVPISGQSTVRGALSYAFARSMDNLVSKQPGSVLTRRDLFGTSRQLVNQYAFSKQNIQTEPAVESEQLLPILRVAGGNITQQITVNSAAVPAKSTKIRIATSNGPQRALTELIPPDDVFEAAASRDEADLIWDQSAQQIISRSSGDVVARNVRPVEVAGVAARAWAVNQIFKMSESRSMSIALRQEPGKLYTPQDRPVFTSNDVAGRYLTIFNLTYDGRVQMLHPGQNAVPRLESADWMLIPVVKPPFGVDQVVAVTSTQPLADLNRWLWNQNERIAADRIPGQLEKAVATNPEMRIGTVGLFTSP
jgi:hypothetical protein